MIPDFTVIDYWILDTKKKTVTGKLGWTKFLGALDSLKIPKDIELIDVYEY
jgi:hypothetical protein